MHGYTHTHTYLNFKYVYKIVFMDFKCLYCCLPHFPPSLPVLSFLPSYPNSSQVTGKKHSFILLSNQKQYKVNKFKQHSKINLQVTKLRSIIIPSFMPRLLTQLSSPFPIFPLCPIKHLFPVIPFSKIFLFPSPCDTSTSLAFPRCQLHIMFQLKLPQCFTTKPFQLIIAF